EAERRRIVPGVDGLDRRRHHDRDEAEVELEGEPRVGPLHAQPPHDPVVVAAHVVVAPRRVLLSGPDPEPATAQASTGRSSEQDRRLGRTPAEGAPIPPARARLMPPWGGGADRGNHRRLVASWSGGPASRL